MKRGLAFGFFEESAFQIQKRKKVGFFVFHPGISFFLAPPFRLALSPAQADSRGTSPVKTAGISAAEWYNGTILIEAEGLTFS
ncbi:MAG: hypothetical protein MR704_10445 [Clostridia bacterium]|nr:hypothetical protein [Clostridia bacterium]